jgi:hypothetical protein
MRLRCSKYVLHFRQSQEHLWEDQDGVLVWSRQPVTLGDGRRIIATSRGVRWWHDVDDKPPPQTLEFPDANWVSQILIVSADILEPLEARVVHVMDVRLVAA